MLCHERATAGPGGDAAAQVLDCGSFLADYASRAPVMSRPELGEGGNLRPVVDLLVEQLECVAAFRRAADNARRAHAACALP
jgi:hypothetical protein